MDSDNNRLTELKVLRKPIEIQITNNDIQDCSKINIDVLEEPEDLLSKPKSETKTYGSDFDIRIYFEALRSLILTLP